MLTDPDSLMVFPQQLTPNDVTIFSHNAHQSIDIFRMLTNQFRQLCHLAFKVL